MIFRLSRDTVYTNRSFSFLTEVLDLMLPTNQSLNITRWCFLKCFKTGSLGFCQSRLLSHPLSKKQFWVHWRTLPWWKGNVFSSNMASSLYQQQVQKCCRKLGQWTRTASHSSPKVLVSSTAVSSFSYNMEKDWYGGRSNRLKHVWALRKKPQQ